MATTKPRCRFRQPPDAGQQAALDERARRRAASQPHTCRPPQRPGAYCVPCLALGRQRVRKKVYA